MFNVANNELLIASINAVIVLSAYFFIYPRFVGSSLKRLAIYCGRYFFFIADKRLFILWKRNQF